MWICGYGKIVLKVLLRQRFEFRFHLGIRWTDVGASFLSLMDRLFCLDAKKDYANWNAAAIPCDGLVASRRSIKAAIKWRQMRCAMATKKRCGLIPTWSLIQMTSMG